MVRVRMGRNAVIFAEIGRALILIIFYGRRGLKITPE
jgi:hypothetical protein